MIRSPRPGLSLRYALVALMTLALASGCGYRPRGSISLPDDIRSIYIDGPVEFADEVDVFLNDEDVKVVDTAGKADAVIAIHSQRFDERVTAVDATTGKAREFELLYTVDYSFRMKDGAVLIPSERVVSRRIYVFDPNAVIGATRNVAALQRDMRQDAAQRIIRAADAALTR